MCACARDRAHTNMLITINQLIYIQASKKTVYNFFVEIISLFPSNDVIIYVFDS